MKALTFHGKRDVRVDEVPDPTIEEPTDAIIRVTSTAHLRLRPAPLRGARAVHDEGDILGHEPMGIVEEVGAEVDRHRGRATASSIPFNISCGHCFMCDAGALLAVRDDAGPRAGQGRRAVRLHQAVRPGARRPGRVPAGAAGAVRPDQGAGGPPDERFLYLSDVLPTAWQAVEYAAIPDGGTLAVLGLGPIGQMACRIALAPRRRQVIGVDLVPERLEMARAPRRRDDRPRRESTTSPARSAS